MKVLQLASPFASGSSASGSHQRWVVQAMGHAPINRTVVENNNIVNGSALAQAIGQAMKSARIKASNVCACMPTTQATSKVISIPANLSVLEQEDFIQLEAPNHIPFPIEEVRMDFEILGPNKNDPSQLDVLLVAAKIDQFQSRVDALAEANTQVVVMDVEMFAVERAMQCVIAANPLPNVAEPIEVVVDVGHEFTYMHVLHNGRSIYNREQHSGMKQLTDELGKQLGLSEVECTKALANHALPKEVAENTLPRFRTEIANLINRLIQFFFAGTSYNRVHRIWLLGGGAGLSGVTSVVGEVTGVPTKIVTIADLLEPGKGVDAQYVHTMAPAFLTAFGLAIRKD